VKNRVTLFSERNFSGQDSVTVDVSPGSGNKNLGRSISVTSILVAPRTTVTLYRDEGLKGRSLTVSGDTLVVSPGFETRSIAWSKSS
jgi:hypothetical protein